MEKEIWYRADYDYVPVNYDGGTDEYFCLLLDEETTMEELDGRAIETAKDYARIGKDFSDIGHVEMELVQVTEVDGNDEFFKELRIIWY